SPFNATRYHSLAVERASLPEVLDVTATADDGEIMAIRHRELPIEGVQFHPEAILTEHGRKLLENFLAATVKTPGFRLRARPSPVGTDDGHHASGRAAAHDRASRDLPRRDAVADAADHERRRVAGDDRRAYRRPSRQEGDDRRDRRGGAGDAGVRDARRGPESG